MRQIVPIPADRAGDFDLVVDVAIMLRRSYDGSRVATRLRIPLESVVDERQRSDLTASIDEAIESVLSQGMTIPDAATS